MGSFKGTIRLPTDHTSILPMFIDITPGQKTPMRFFYTSGTKKKQFEEVYIIYGIPGMGGINKLCIFFKQ